MQFLNIPTDAPAFMPPATAWVRHGPFALWLVRALQPGRIVELGTHYGYSYFCFCQAVAAGGLSTECYAVDTWKGDEHAGSYDESVYETVQAENNKYHNFSTLIRKTFAEALDDIEDGSVDLLHIDGRHFYDDVKEDFESWVPKLSDRAIVLFHDTEVRERNFGVWRYWSEISTKRPSLNFPYQHGLGVLFWGSEIAEGMVPLLSLVERADTQGIVIDHFESLGENFVHQYAQSSSESDARTKLELKLEIANFKLENAISRRTQVETNIEKLQSSLYAARRYPLKQLKRKIAFKALRSLAKASPPLSPRAADRFRRSAAKRDPARDDLENYHPATKGYLEKSEFPTNSEYLKDLNSRVQLALNSGLWDERWYLKRHNLEIQTLMRQDAHAKSPLHHYLIEGWKLGYAPSPNFGLKRDTRLKYDPLTNFLRRKRLAGYQFEDNVWAPTLSQLESYHTTKLTRKSEKVIYTCIMGNYDDLIHPMSIENDWDYVCFTDAPELLAQKNIGVWEIRPPFRDGANPSLTNRWHKMFPNKVLSEYKESIYLDGNINILSPYLFEQLRNSSTNLMLPRHFSRDCVYEEIDTIVESILISDSQAKKLYDLVDCFVQEGFPRKWGLTENNVIYRKHHDASIASLMHEWWWHVENTAPRDQAFFTYLLWKSGYKLGSITFPNCRQIYRDFAVVRHNTQAEILLKKKLTRKIFPAFGGNAVSIVLSCNEGIINYLDVLLTSIRLNSSETRQYDIIILECDVSDESKRRVLSSFNDLSNFSIRFYNMAGALSSLGGERIHAEGNASIETYNKIFLNEILSGYNKVAYIDTELALNRDISILYDFDLQGRSIAAAPNIADIHAAYVNKEIKGRDFKRYLQEDLGVLDATKYFNAGVVLIDLQHPNTKKLFRKAVEKIREIRKPIFFDQCIFNSLFYGDVQFLPCEWNHVLNLQEYSYLRGTVPEELFFDYARSRNNPAIINFASGDKPAKKIEWKLGEYFWHYARKSNSYERIIGDLPSEGAALPQVRIGSAASCKADSNIKILVHVHLFCEDQVELMLNALKSMTGYSCEVYITVQKGYSLDKTRFANGIENCHFIKSDNIGYDVYPFLQVLKKVDLSEFDYILKLHTKSPRGKDQEAVYGTNVEGDRWRDALVNSIAGSPEVFRRNIEELEVDRSIGALAANAFIFSVRDNNEEKVHKLEHWKRHFNLKVGHRYPGGTMFLSRAFPFQRFASLEGQEKLFGAVKMKTQPHEDFAHVLERLFGIAIENEKMRIKGI